MLRYIILECHVRLTVACRPDMGMFMATLDLAEASRGKARTGLRAAMGEHLFLTDGGILPLAPPGIGGL